MNITADTAADLNCEFRERLQQAKRVLEGLSEEQRENNFEINVFARQSARGIVACIAGYCGLDPWFQERDFVTRVGDPYSIGDVSIPLAEFFGTVTPFLACFYGTDRVTVERALRALDEAIATLPSATNVLLPASNE